METKFKVEFSDNMIENPLVHVSSDSNGIVQNYEMTMDEFLHAMLSSEIIQKIRKETVVVAKKNTRIFANRIETPELPRNCVKHIWVNRIQKDQVVLVEVPKQKWDVEYYNTTFKNVGFPRLIFGYWLDKDLKINHMYCFTVAAKGRITDQTELYMFPFANVYQSGKICMGGNQLPTLKNVAQLESMHQLFFSSPSSTDFFNPSNTFSGIDDLRGLYRRLEETDFPEDWLKPTGENLGTRCRSFK